MDELPDDIINLIFTYLNVKDATMFSISFSQRWRHFLSNLTVLDFDASKKLMLQVTEQRHSSTRVKNLRTYANWINYVLSLNSAPQIDTFRLCWVLVMGSSCYFDPDFDSWLKFAAQKQVKELVLDVTVDTKTIEAFPDHIAINATRNVHKYALRYDLFKSKIDDGGLNLLKSLCLKSVDIEGELLDSILCHCKYLERVKLVDSNVLNLKRLKLRNSFRRLKHFGMSNCFHIKELEIHTRDVVSLEVECRIYWNPVNLQSENDNIAVVFEFDLPNYEYTPAPVINVSIDYFVRTQQRTNQQNPNTSVEFGDHQVSSVMRNLKLKGVGVSSGVLEYLLYRFKFLQNLSVVNSSNLVGLEIKEESSKNLQFLQIHGCDNMKELKIHSAPCLKTLDLYETKLYVNVTFGSVPSLINVRLRRITHDSFSKFSMNSNITAQLTKLSLHTCIFRKRIETFPAFDNVRQLKLLVDAKHYKNLWIVKSFVKKCPMLEEFKLQFIWLCDYYDSYLSRCKGLNHKQKWKEEKLALFKEDNKNKLIRGTLPQLKKFELIGAFTIESCDDYEYPMVLSIIRNAIHLQKFIFNGSGSNTKSLFPSVLGRYTRRRQMDAAQQLAELIPSNVDVEIIIT